mgnify:FL=1
MDMDDTARLSDDFVEEKEDKENQLELALDPEITPDAAPQ